MIASCRHVPLLALLLIASLGAAVAAKWDPVPAELADTEDCHAEPGCNAIVLRYDVRWDNEFHDARVVHHVLMKILKPDGLDAAAIKLYKIVGLWNLIDIQGRTIRPDGTTEELRERSIMEETEAKVRRGRLKAVSFQLPAAEVGALLEYRYTQSYNGRLPFLTWHVQRDYPIREAHITIKPGHVSLRSPVPVNLGSVRLRTGEDEKGDFVVSTGIIPSFRQEPWMPPDDEARGRIVFYPKAPWWGVSAIRNGFDSFLAKYYKRSAKAKKLAREVLGEAASPEDKLRLIYRHVQDGYVNTSYRETAEGEVDVERNLYVDDVIRNGQGSAADMVRLFVFLARKAGFDAEVALVATRDEKFLRPELLLPLDFDQELAAVVVDGKWRFFDPGTRYCPMGLVGWESEGLGPNAIMPREGRDGGRMVQIPASTAAENRVRRKIDIALAEHGSITAAVDAEFHGLSGARVRNQVDNLGPEERVTRLEERLQEHFPGARVEDLEYANLESWSEPLRMHYRFRVDGYGAAAGSRLLVRPVLFPEANPFTAEERQQPIYFRRTMHERDEITLRVPDGYEVESLLRRRKVDIGAIRYEIVSMTEDDERLVLVERDLVVDVLLVDARNYEIVRDLYEEAARVDLGEIVLRAGSADEVAGTEGR